MSKLYSSNLTDNQYAAILGIIGDTRKRKRSLKPVFDAIFYLLKTGCQWRMLPKSFPPWQTGYYYFRKWSLDGIFKKVHGFLRSILQQKVGREIFPGAKIIDNQSVFGIHRGKDRGVDSGKRVKGRKRHIITDTQGLLLAVKANPANRHDSKAVFEVIRVLKPEFGRMKSSMQIEVILMI